MRKLLLTLLIAALWISAGFAQKASLINLNPKESKFEVLSQKSTGFTFVNSVAELNLKPVSVEKGNFMNLEINGLVKIYDEGIPNIPVISKLIEVPLGAKVEFKIKSYDEEIIKLSDYSIFNKIQPALRSESKSEDGVPFILNDEVYKKDEFINNEIAVYEESGQLRAVRLGRIEIRPVQYNPAKNTLRILNNLVIEVNFKGADISATNALKRKYNTPYYNNMMAGQVINYDFNAGKELITQGPTHLAIVSDRMFEAQLAPFIAWKIKKGFDVTVGYTDVIGSDNNSIKTWLQAIYEGSNPMSFVLLVGDIQQIPEWTINEHTDLRYCEYTGDNLPEVYYGRFSAQNTTQLQPQIDKTLMYEQYTMSDPSYLEQVFLVAGDDSGHEMTWGNGQIWYGDNYYFNASNNVNSHTFLQPLDNGAISDSIIANMNAGLAFANYTAHCGPSGWSTPSFTSTDVSNLTNNEKYGLWIGNCCSSVEFHQDECFGEAALRKENGGAIGDIGGSNSTYWDEDYWWGVGLTSSIVAEPAYEESGRGAYDGVWHNLANEVGDIATWFPAQGQINVCGNLAVEASASTRKQYYWEIYHLMGDPSITNYIGTPQLMTVTPSPAALMIGMTALNVSSAPYALVALSQAGVLIDAVVSDASGNASLSFASDALSVGDADLVVTCQNKVPYIGTITVSPADEPYIVLNSFTTNIDPDFGQTVELNVTLENVAETGSGFDAGNVVAVLSLTDAYVTITDDTENYGIIVAGATSTVNAAFTIDIADDVQDQYMFNFDLTITGDDAKYTWPATLTLTADAPVISIGNLTVTNDDNTDGILDPGETADLVITATNTGHADITNVISAISSTSTDLTINTATNAPVTLTVDETGNFTFNVTADVATPLGTPAYILNDITGGENDQYSAQKEFTVIIGFVPEYCESGATNSGDTEIQEVYFGDVVNITAGECATYSDFTDNELLTDVFVIGSVNDIKFFLGNCDAGSFTKAGKVYIDWNYDGDFEDDGEMVYESEIQNANWLTEGTFTVPVTANAGQKFMRIVVSEDENNINPCGTYLYGETEDYKIYLFEPLAPIADFEADQTIITAGETVNFTDLSENYPTSWTWTVTPGTEGVDFVYENSTSSISQNPSVKFITPDSYNVELTVTNSVASDTETKTNYITVNPVSEVPVADFVADRTDIPAGDVVSFTDLSTNLPNAWEWTIEPMTGVIFVNTTSSTSQNPEVQFDQAGSYTISLVSSNGFGSSDMHTKTDYITVVSEILIGDGTEEPTNYPFHNRWENNKTQIIYYQSEIGGAKTLTKIAFDFSFITSDPAYRTMTDYTVKMMHTTENAFSGAYFNTDGASVVFFESSYTLPDATGWHTFNINNFVYNGTDNLLVEIVWGDNGSYCSYGDSYKVYATDVAKANLVAYGYSDTETPPDYDSQSAIRPNIIFSFGDGTTYTITYSVTDGTDPIEDATVDFNGESIDTDALGIAVFNNVDEDMGVAYTVTKTGYETFNETVDVDADKTVDVVLTPVVPVYTITFNVSDGTNSIEGATVDFNSESIDTDASGIAVFNDVEEGMGVAYTVTKTGYETFNETVDVDADKTVNVILTESVELVSLENNIKLLPNPSNGKFKIDFGGLNPDNTIIEVYSVSGKIIFQTNVNTNVYEIDLSNASKGIYFVKIRYNEQVYNSKLMLK